MRFDNSPAHVCRHAPSVSLLAVGVLLAACGGGQTSSSPATTTASTAAAPTTPVATPVVTPPVTAPATSAAAPLVLSAATTAAINGTLNKTAPAVQYESTIGDSTGGFSSSGANDLCRVAASAMPNSSNALPYNLEVVFSKTTWITSYAIITQVGGSASFAARDVAPNLTGITVDVANRRLSFANQTLGSTGATA